LKARTVVTHFEEEHEAHPDETLRVDDRKMESEALESGPDSSDRSAMNIPSSKPATTLVIDGPPKHVATPKEPVGPPSSVQGDGRHPPGTA
jgi:hypothetical protein